MCYLLFLETINRTCINHFASLGGLVFFPSKLLKKKSSFIKKNFNSIKLILTKKNPNFNEILMFGIL